jgi:hypothetical protein
MLDDEKSISARFWNDVVTEGNVDLIDEILSPDFVLYELAARHRYDREGLKIGISLTRSIIPPMAATVDEALSAENNQIVTRLTLRAPGPRLNPNPIWAGNQPYEFTLTGRAGGHEFSLHLSPAGSRQPSIDRQMTADPGNTEGTSSDRRPEVIGVSIYRIDKGQIQEGRILWGGQWSAFKPPEDSAWHWPPWSPWW